jgi:SWI/SNF-related matrix-associated actin-dependent regulator of chromatin subfamily A member 5
VIVSDFLYCFHFSLGKTLQTILFLAWLREHRDIQGPHLVVVPLNVLDTWVSEVQRWCPTMRAVRFHGSEKERQRIYRESLQFDPKDNLVIVTTYETVVLHSAFFRYHFLFAYVIVDEAHRIKNENSLLAVALRHVPSLNKLLLTGTPLQKSVRIFAHALPGSKSAPVAFVCDFLLFLCRLLCVFPLVSNLHELWALLNFLYPHLFPLSDPFDQGFDLAHHHVDNNVLLAAQALLGPIMIRRLKRDVATKLPPKTETQVQVKLAPFQIHWYKAILASHAGLLEQLGTEVQKDSDDAAVVEERLNADLASSGDAMVLEQQAQLDADGNISNAQLAALPEDPTPEPAGSGRKKTKAQQEEEDDLAGVLQVTANAGNEWRKLMNLLMQLRKVCNVSRHFPTNEAIHRRGAHTEESIGAGQRLRCSPFAFPVSFSFLSASLHDDPGFHSRSRVARGHRDE